MNYDDDTNNEYGDESLDESIEAIMEKDNDLEDSDREDDFLGWQGCGQKYGEFNCKECRNRFLREHGQSIVCLNDMDWSTRQDCTVHTLIVGLYSRGDFYSILFYTVLEVTNDGGSS